MADSDSGTANPDPPRKDAPGRQSPDDLGEVMSRIARSLQGEHGDVEQTLAAITGAAVHTVPGADWASISLVTGRRISSRASTTELAREIDALQTELDEGPCLDALRQQTTVRVPDFNREQRWPRFAAEACRRGAGSLLSFQLFTEGDNLGALNLYGQRPNSFDAESETVGVLFAAHAAIALSAARQEQNLRRAIDKRDLIGQAKGILMERHKLTAPQAFAVLARASTHTNRKLFDIADELTSTGSMPED
jgi:GAF domain-containing protein